MVYYPEFTLACAATFFMGAAGSGFSFYLWVTLAVFAALTSGVFVLTPVFRDHLARLPAWVEFFRWLRRISASIFLVGLFGALLNNNDALEPFLPLSGISIWVSLLILAFMILLTLCWFAWLSDDGLPWECRPQSFKKKWPLSKNPFLGEWVENPIAGFSDYLQIGVNETVAGDADYHTLPWANLTMVSFARLLKALILVGFLLWEINFVGLFGNKELNWAFMPTAPARGGLAIGLATFIHTLAILMVMQVSTVTFGQLLALRKFISRMDLQLGGKHFQTETIDPNNPDWNGFIDDFNGFVYICRLLESLSMQSSRRGLWWGAALVLLFAFGRLPIWDNWHLDSSAITVIVLVPFVLAFPVAIYTRGVAQSLRNKLIKKLSVFEVELTGDSVLLNDEKHRKLVLGHIKAANADMNSLKQGAFGSIWRDPLMGSVLMIFTSLFTGPGKQIVNHLVGLLA